MGYRVNSCDVKHYKKRQRHKELAIVNRSWELLLQPRRGIFNVWMAVWIWWANFDVRSSTTLSTVVITTTSQESKTPGDVVAKPRGFQTHELDDVLAARASQDGSRTPDGSAIPAYASACPSSRAYASACSCHGVSASTSAPITTSHVPITASQTSTIIDNALSLKGVGRNSSQFRNSTSSTFKNTSTALFPNSTSHTMLLTSSPSSNASVSLTLFESASFTNTWRFSSPTKAGVSSSSSSQSHPSIVSATSISNATFGNLANDTQLLNITSTGKYFNTTTPTISALNAANTSQPFNETTAAPFMNITSAPIATITPAPQLNQTHPLAANTTIPPFHNSTSSTRFANTTATTSSAPTPTQTIDRTCGETSTPFTVQVGQPGGMFDDWFLKLSGDAILFVPDSATATQFSVEGSGHLCAVGSLGTQGNAIIAIAENATDITGSGVYFIDPEVLEDIDELGYAALQCEVGADALSCSEGAKGFWVGCGLGLDITSDGDGSAEIGGWDCTGVTLAPVYS
ncbi:hypothetical protein MGN70_010399 [Eutypa lata]|nr:hypothetical protein MGN70_010399 [Eutypa lata]